MTTLYTRRDLDLAIRRTGHDEAFWELMLNESKAQSGPFDGGCLICARALAKAFEDATGGARVVCMTSPLNGGQVEHFGVRIGHFICDFNGTFTSPKNWIDTFVAEEHIHDRVLSFEDVDKSDPNIVDDPQASERIAAMLRSFLPDLPGVVRQQVRAFRAVVLQDPDIIAARAQGLEFDLGSTTDGLEIASIGMPVPLRGHRVASKFLKRLCELADAHQVPLLLEVGTDEAGIRLSDWYERRGFYWAQNVMERMPKAEPPDHGHAKNKPIC